MTVDEGGDVHPFTIAVPDADLRIDGIDLHFVHARSSRPDPVPVVLTHGWPGSFLEFEQVIDLLIDPPTTTDRPSTWSYRRCPGTVSAADPPGRGGTSIASPEPGAS